MFKVTVNTIGFALVAFGAFQGVEAFLNVNATAEPLAYTAAGSFVLMITNLTGE